MESELEGRKGGYELVEFVIRSENRTELLFQIYEGEEVERDELKGLMSDSTLTNEKNDLIDHGLVEEDGSTYRITDKGKFLSNHLLSVLDSGQMIKEDHEIIRFLNQVPDWDGWRLPLKYLEDASIYVNDEDYGNSPYNKYVDQLTEASHVCELVHRTIVLSGELDEEFVATDMTGQFIGNPSIAGDSEINERRFRGWRKKYENGAEYRVLNERKIQFTLSLFDLDDDGEFEGIGIFPSNSNEKDIFLYSENEEFITWGEDMFNQLWTEAGGVCPMDPAIVSD